jgi:hypothetical protein
MREVPLSGEPADVHDRIAAYSAWLKTASLPKLFIDAEPGVFITGRIRKLASSFLNQRRVVVSGLHFVQEDSPCEIGRALASWLGSLSGETEAVTTGRVEDWVRRNNHAVDDNLNPKKPPPPTGRVVGFPDKWGTTGENGICVNLPRSPAREGAHRECEFVGRR